MTDPFWLGAGSGTVAAYGAGRRSGATVARMVLGTVLARLRESARTSEASMTESQAVSGVEVPGSSVLAVFTSSSGSTEEDLGIATAVSLVMLVITVTGIRITASLHLMMHVHG